MRIDDYNLHKYLLMMIIIFSALKSSTIMELIIIFQCDYKSVPEHITIMVKR